MAASPDTRDPDPPTEEYPALLEQALALLETSTGKLWDDRGEHDPGVTLLELLCYALGRVMADYRVDDASLFAIPDRAGWYGTPRDGHDWFTYHPGIEPWPVKRVWLDSAPVSAADYRRLLMSGGHVVAAWVDPEPARQACCREGWPAWVEFPPSMPPDERHAALAALHRQAWRARGLGQGPLTVHEIRPAHTVLTVQATLSPGVDATTGLARIIDAVENVLRPIAPLDRAPMPTQTIDIDAVRLAVLACPEIAGVGALHLEPVTTPDGMSGKGSCSTVASVDATFQNTMPPPDIPAAFHLAARYRAARSRAIRDTDRDGEGAAPAPYRPTPYRSVQNWFPEVYGFSGVETFAAERAAGIRQFQGLIIMLEQVLADAAQPCAEASAWLSGQRLDPDDLVGPIKDCPAVAALGQSEETYRQALARHRAGDDLPVLSNALAVHLASRQGHAPLSRSDTARIDRLFSSWLTALPFLDRNRLGAHPEPAVHPGPGDAAASPLEQSLGFLLARHASTNREDWRDRVGVLRETNPVAGENEYRAYIKGYDDRVDWAGTRMFRHLEAAVQDGARMVAAMADPSRYRVRTRPAVVVSVVDDRHESAAVWMYPLSGYDAAAAAVRKSVRHGRTIGLPWVRILEGARLCGQALAGCLVVLLDGHDIPVDNRTDIEQEAADLLPAHLLPRFVWLGCDILETLRPLADHTRDDLSPLWQALEPYLENPNEC